MACRVNSYKLTVSEVKGSIALCKLNAHRLVTDASTLLEHGGRAGLAYALWSLAVEEYGKAVLLDQLATGKTSRDTISVPQLLFRGQHKEKYFLERDQGEK